MEYICGWSTGGFRCDVPVFRKTHHTKEIELHKTVLEDNGPIAKISILNGIMSERSIISLSGSAFLVTMLMLFVGIYLLITSPAYVCSGIRIYSLCSMSMFVITKDFAEQLIYL